MFSSRPCWRELRSDVAVMCCGSSWRRLLNPTQQGTHCCARARCFWHSFNSGWENEGGFVTPQKQQPTQPPQARWPISWKPFGVRREGRTNRVAAWAVAFTASRIACRAAGVTSFNPTAQCSTLVAVWACASCTPIPWRACVLASAKPSAALHTHLSYLASIHQGQCSRQLRRAPMFQGDRAAFT